MDDKLKPCAHCGGKAEIGRIFGRIGISCTECGINIRSEIICGETGYDGIVEAWNKRPEAANKTGLMPDELLGQRDGLVELLKRVFKHDESDNLPLEMLIDIEFALRRAESE